jgi:hypothetical protein
MKNNKPKIINYSLKYGEQFIIKNAPWIVCRQKQSDLSDQGHDWQKFNIIPNYENKA